MIRIGPTTKVDIIRFRYDEDDDQHVDCERKPCAWCVEEAKARGEEQSERREQQRIDDDMDRGP